MVLEPWLGDVCQVVLLNVLSCKWSNKPTETACKLQSVGQKDSCYHLSGGSAQVTASLQGGGQTIPDKWAMSGSAITVYKLHADGSSLLP